MIQSILVGVCLAGVSLLLPLSVLLWLHAHGIRPVDEVLTRFRRLPMLARFLLLAMVVNLIVYGSTKTNQVDGSSSPTNAPPPSLGLMMRSPAAFETGFTDEELAQGHAIWRVGTNETWSFAPVPEAVFAEKWLLRGAAEDRAEFSCEGSFTGPAVMDTFGRLCWSNTVYSVLDRQLAVVPESNWHLLGSNVQSRVWSAVTPWDSTIFTWENVLLDRDTNMPVSVQAEFTLEGHYVYRYDLSRAGTNLTSVLHYAIQPEDLEEYDRDGDGIPNWEEVKRYHSDPGLVDSDGDGWSDYDEIMNGTDPSVRSVPNEEIVARVTGSPTNELYGSCEIVTDGSLVSMKLWDGFAADWNSTNDVVYERTLDLGIQSGWQHYFLSSKSDAAGGWDLRGLVLEWDDGCGSSGQANVSPRGDSFYLPLTNFSPRVTIRLRAVGPKIRAPKPMWLVGYAPDVSFGGGQLVVSDDGRRAALVFNVQNGEAAINFSFDRSQRPCKAPLYPAERLLPGVEDAADVFQGAASYEGDENAGTLTLVRPGEYEFPSMRVDEITNPSLLFAYWWWPDGFWIVLIDPSISWGKDHRYSLMECFYDWQSDEYSVTNNYPLNSRCLWENWQRNYYGGWDECFCRPEVKSGAEGPGAWLVSTDYSINERTMIATGYVKIFDHVIWSATCEHSYGDTGDDWYGGGMHTGCTLLTELEECEECEDSCTGGKCNYGEESTLNSVKFRLPLGTPRTGQTSGWIYFESDDPVAISPGLFQWMVRADAAVTHTQSGSTRTWRCSDNRGRTVVLTPIQDGVRLTVSDTATQALDHTWDITNVNGSPDRIRLLRRNKRSQRMVDETYAYSAGGWSKTDNVTGLREVLHRVNDVNGSGQITETRTKYDANDNQLDRTVSVSTRIGRYDHAVVRETYFEQNTGFNVKWRQATYWDDPSHAARHGQLKLLTGNSTAWEYHDWNGSGFETLRVEQRNGSDVPASFPEVFGGELVGLGALADATVTVFDYTPVGDDDRLAEDNGRVRSEKQYVVRNGVATCVAKTWHVFTHQWVDGYPALRIDTYRAAAVNGSWSNPSNAHSYVIVLDESADGVPIVMRGMTVEEVDERGVFTCHGVWEDWDCIYDEEWTEFGGQMSPTTKITTKDALYGNVLSVETYASDWWEVIDSESSTYDDQNRLLTTTYHDRTQLENWYSCCRLLQSRDREGRLTVRSAVTGEDKVYYAEEAVYLNEIQTNGFGVTQHFMDALGRETRTVTYLGAVQGEAIDWTVSQGRERTVSTTSYPYGGDDYSEAVDERGKRTVTAIREYADRVETEESVYPSANASRDLRTVTTDYRNGDLVTETYWGSKWKREYTVTDYDANGCRIETSVTESSDYGTVTNRIVRHDFLGRAVEMVEPDGITTTSYFGASTRPSGSVKTSGNIVRTRIPVYNDLGEEVGATADGVTTRTDVTYEHDEDEWSAWKVTRSTRAADGFGTEVIRESRERLTCFGEGVRSERIDIDANGVATTNTVRYNAADGTVTTTYETPVSSPSVQTSKYGLTLSTETGDGILTYGYDAFGRCIRRDRDGRIAETSDYNEYGDVVARHSYTNAVGCVSETFVFDTYGRQVSAVDALGNEIWTDYDANGLVTEQSGATYPVRYGYDALGNRVSLRTTKNGRAWDTTAWTIDPATSRRTAKSYPGGARVAFTYTADGLEQRETQASGVWRERVYDAQRQWVGTVYSDSTLNVQRTSDAFGRLLAETNAASGVAYVRAKDGMATNEDWCVGAHQAVLERQRDAFGRISGRGLTNGVWQSVSYTDENRIGTIAASEATVTYAYAEDGSELGSALVVAGGATVARQVIRDPYRPELVLAISNFVNGVAIDGANLGYDAKGRVVTREDGRRETRDEFEYDEVGQVVRAINYQFPTTNSQLTSYAYDQIGNFAGQTVAYDIDGQLAEEGDFSFSYDDAGRLCAVASNGVVLASYAYDPQERRVLKVTPTATHTYFYDGWVLIREVIDRAGGESETIDYSWGRDLSGTLDGADGVGGLLYVKRGSSIYMPLYDHNGNVTAYVDASGTVVASFAYDTFGNVTAATGSLADDFSFRFSTKYTDPESGLLYYGYRYYSPASRIWLTRDPLGEDAGLNLHAFCKNNPLNGYDALGQYEVDRKLIERLRKDWRLFAYAAWPFFPLASEYLQYALNDNPKSPHIQSDGSRAANLIRASDLYKTKLMSYIIKDQRKLDQRKLWESDDFVFVATLQFEGIHDLHYAINRADMYIKGAFCRNSRTIKVKKTIEVKVQDDYDWHRIVEARKWENLFGLLTKANNIAHFDSQIGVINEYQNRIIFFEPRVGRSEGWK